MCSAMGFLYSQISVFIHDFREAALTGQMVDGYLTHFKTSQK